MKTRIITAVVGIPIVAVVFLLLPVWVLGIGVGAVAAMCAWEYLHCTEKNMPYRIVIYTAVVSFLICFLQTFYDPGKVALPLVFLLFILAFVEVMLSFRGDSRLPLSTVTNALFAGGMLPVLLSSFVRLGTMECGAVCAFLPLVVSFSSDGGAYFAGMAFGRHKLTPRLSPHKTVEGSIGGFVLAIVATLVYGLILRALHYQVNLAVLGACGFLGSLAAQVGDLSFSAVKRLTGIKDFGHVIPGHGGMLDRCDSLIWAATLLQLLLTWVPAILPGT